MAIEIGTDLDDPVLEVEGLTKRFGRLTAVDDVSFALPEGRFQGLIGPNGAGKSTLFDMLSGLQSPTDGRIVLTGTDVTNMAPHDRAQNGLGRSFQIVDAFDSLTVRENLKLGVQAMSSSRHNPVRPLRSYDGVTERTDELLAEFELDDVADDPAHELPYGDLRKLELALALASDPEVLLLDEPTAGLSIEQADAIETLIGEVAEDKTVLLAEHRVDMIMNVSDRIMVLHEGQLIAEGTPEAIVDNPDVQEAYLGGYE